MPKDYTFERGFCVGERTGFGTATLLHMGDEELVQIALRYLREGYSDPRRILDTQGLRELLG